MYLVDTNVLSEIRKKAKSDFGVRQFFANVMRDDQVVYVSVVTVGELRRGVESIRHRGDERQAKHLENWLAEIVLHYQDHILEVDEDVAQLWGRLRVPNPENALDKLIAATALIHDLTVVTRNQKDFETTGVRVHNPFVN